MHKRMLLAAALAAVAVVRPAPAALSTTNSVVTATSNGVQTAFATGYRFLDNSHLVVTKTVSGVTTTLTLGVDFSVTGANAQAGGTVTLGAAIPNGAVLTIKRSTPRTQTCSLRTVSNQTAAAIENCLDRETMILQEMNDGTFTQLLATPVTADQSTTAAASTSPNSTNTNTAGSSSALVRADHTHLCATASATQVGCVTAGTQTWAGVKTFSSQPVLGLPMAYATSSSGVFISTGAFAIVVYGTEVRDTDSAYDPATGRFTVPASKGGDYLVSCAIEWSAGLTGQSVLGIFKNAVEQFEASKINPIASDSVTVTAIVNVAAGDLLDCRVFQNSAGSVSLRASIPAGMFITIKQLSN